MKDSTLEQSSFWLTARTNVKLKNQAPAIKPVSRHQNLPLSFNQERLWSLEQLQPNTSVYNLLHCLRLKGLLNVAALEQSLLEIARRHEILRTTFKTVDGQPVQIIAENIAWKLPVIDLRELAPHQRETTAQKLALEDAEQPFDLAAGPLWRIKLLRLGQEEYVLFRTIHHIIFDGESQRAFMRELRVLYTAFCAGESSPLPELPIQYADYAHTQRQWLQGEVFSSGLDYWQQQLSGNVAALELPTDYPRPLIPSYQGAYQPLELSEHLSAAIKKLSSQERVRPHVMLLAAFKTLLYLYTQQEDMVVCTPVAGRHGVDTQALIGYFNNVVVMRTDLSGNPSFRELLGQVSRVHTDTLPYQDIPLQKVAQLPNLARTPLTRAMFVWQNIPNLCLELDGLSVTSVYVDRQIANFDLSLSMQEQGGKLIGGVQYKTDLFKPTTISEMLEHFQTLLETLVASPERCLKDLPLLGTASPHLLFDNNLTCASFPSEPSETFVAPGNELERQLSLIWQQVLGIDSIGVKDNFFELGGHSLAGVRLFTKIEETFGKSLPLSTLFQAPTIEQLATILSKTRGSVPPRVSLVAIQPQGSKPPLFVLNGLGEIPFSYWSLAHHLGTDQPVYSWESYGKRALYTRIEDRAAHYIKELRSLQPEGPYFIGGFCGGGTMAFEVAQQLHAQDQKVALLALFDYVPRKSDDCESRNSWKLDSFIYFLWNLVYLLKDFLQSPLSEQFDRIQTRIKLLIKKISNNSELNSPNTNALIPSIEQTINHVLSKVPEDIHEEYRKSLEAQGRSFIDYVPQLYSGRVALFLSRRWSFWRFLKNKIAATEVTLKVISAGNHATILQEPYAQVLAEQLRDCLDKAQADSSDQKSNILVWESEILSVK